MRLPTFCRLFLSRVQVITFRKGLVKCRDYIFNFLENPMIPFDNNGSERGIRKLKIKLKNSCAFRSDFGADAFLELHSIVETAKKHDKTPYNAIQALFKVWKIDMHLYIYYRWIVTKFLMKQALDRILKGSFEIWSDKLKVLYNRHTE